MAAALTGLVRLDLGAHEVMQPPRLPKLSTAASRLLRGHRPGIPAYLSWALGPVKTEAELLPIDAAYAELVANGLLLTGDAVLAVLPGQTRAPFVLTLEGDRVRHLARR